MSNEAKTIYQKRIQERYRAASREAKKAILDEFCEVFDYNRKYAIRKLGGSPVRRTESREGIVFTPIHSCLTFATFGFRWNRSVLAG